MSEGDGTFESCQFLQFFASIRQPTSVSPGLLLLFLLLLLFVCLRIIASGWEIVCLCLVRVFLCVCVVFVCSGEHEFNADNCDFHVDRESDGSGDGKIGRYGQRF